MDPRISGSMAVAAPPLAETELPSCLHLSPEPIDDALCRGIARCDDKEFCERCFVGIDILVVENFGGQEFLTCDISISVGQEIGIPRRNLGPVQEIDQLIGFRDI